MPYVLYQENQIPLTKSQKEKNIAPTYTVDKIKVVESREQADAWVNKDSESRGWSYRD
jgi:hypothetical protein